MIKTIKRNARYVVPASGIAFGIATYAAYELFFERRRHPLVRHARTIIEQDERMQSELGSKGKVSLIIHKFSNPHDNEYGFSYKLKGRKSHAQVIVIGDYRTHAELNLINTRNTNILANCETLEDKVKLALESKEFMPINLGRFFIPSTNIATMQLRTDPIKDHEKMWRMKELIIEVPPTSRKLVVEDTLKDIVGSEYRLATYNDAHTKLLGSLQQFKQKLSPVESKVETPVAPQQSRILWLLFIGFALGATYLRLRKMKGSIESSPPYHMALSRVRSSTVVKNAVGEYVGALWTKGFVQWLIGRARFVVHVYGKTGEVSVKVSASRPIFKRSEKKWQIKKLTLMHNGQTINI